MEGGEQREKHEQVIIQQYKDLFERSNKYFAGLRELPQYGSKRLWQPYFQKTFDTYTQLWKYQLDHRQVLDRKYGLKRVEIGDIAAKIAQLYYHYYLRTSDARYLQESFVFYDAIRTRKYFDDVRRENFILYTKKLRFYARFIVVCLLQNKRSLVEYLLRDLKDNANSSSLSSSNNNNISLTIPSMNQSSSSPSSSSSSTTTDNEWQLVISELESFIKADTVVTIDEDSDLLSYRQHKLIGFNSSNSTSGRVTPQQEAIVLSEAILIGNRRKQVKFSELTLDMYRMMQAIEYVNTDNRRPSLGNSGSTNSGATGTTPRSGNAIKNPRKNMLYRPGYSDILSVLSSSVSELEYNENGAILFYVSADAAKDGLALNPKKRQTMFSSPTPSPSSASPSPTGSASGQFGTFTDANCLTMDDLVPFTRRPFFMIVDSDNSACMMPRLTQPKFGQPFVCLMAPRATIPLLQNPFKSGSLFTYYLTSPVLALACTHGMSRVSHSSYEQLTDYLIQQYTLLLDVLLSNDQLDSSLRAFLDNDFLQRFLLNYLLCRVAMIRYFNEQIKDETAQKIHYLPAAFPEFTMVQEGSPSQEYQLLSDTIDHMLVILQRGSTQDQ